MRVAHTTTEAMNVMPAAISPRPTRAALSEPPAATTDTITNATTASTAEMTRGPLMSVLRRPLCSVRWAT